MGGPRSVILWAQTMYCSLPGSVVDNTNERGSGHVIAWLFTSGLRTLRSGQDCLVHLQDTVAARGWTVVTVQVDRMIGVAKGRNRLPGLAAVLGAIARHEVDAIVVQSLHHLGSRSRACWRPWPNFIGMV